MIVLLKLESNKMSNVALRNSGHHQENFSNLETNKLL